MNIDKNFKAAVDGISLNERAGIKVINECNGKLRIIGQVVEESFKNVIGYVITPADAKIFKIYTIEQTKLMLQRFEFINAKYDSKNDKIINTECDMNKILKFNSTMNVVGNIGITVLAEIYNNNKLICYRVIDSNACSVDLTEESVLALINRGFNLINAKRVKRNGNYIISAIKTEFPKIRVERTVKVVSDNKKASVIKKASRPKAYDLHRDKLENRYLFYVLNALGRTMAGESIHLSNFTFCRDNFSGPNEAHDELKRRANIIVNEIIKKALHNNVMSPDDVKLCNRIVPIALDRINRSTHSSEIFIYSMLEIVQFIIYSDGAKKAIKLRRDHYKKEWSISYKTGSYLDKFLRNKENTCGELTKNINFELLSTEKRRNGYPQNKYWTITDFSSSKSIHELGFTLLKSSGDIYTTEDNRTIRLKYVGKYIRNYDEYKDLANCLGDVLIPAQIARTLECDYFTDYEKVVRVETMLAILAMFRADICAKVIEDNKEAIGFNEMLPNFDLSTQQDFGLSNSIKVYYKSGLNVFLNDKKHPKHKDSVYINYRSIGNRVKINSTELKDELESKVYHITSSRCSIEAIENVIGNLRVL